MEYLVGIGTCSRTIVDQTETHVSLWIMEIFKFLGMWVQYEDGHPQYYV